MVARSGAWQVLPSTIGMFALITAAAWGQQYFVLNFGEGKPNGYSKDDAQNFLLNRDRYMKAEAKLRKAQEEAPLKH